MACARSSCTRRRGGPAVVAQPQPRMEAAYPGWSTPYAARTPGRDRDRRRGRRVRRPPDELRAPATTDAACTTPTARPVIPVYLYRFDLMWLAGRDVTALPSRRKHPAPPGRRLRRPCLIRTHLDERWRGAHPRGLRGRGGRASSPSAPTAPTCKAAAPTGSSSSATTSRSRHRRFHRPAGIPGPASASCSSATTRTAAALRRQGRHRLRPQAMLADLGAVRGALGRRPPRSLDAGVRRRERTAAAPTCRPGRVRRVDPRRRPAPPALPGTPRRQVPEDVVREIPDR